jgi:hypothetical protein
VVIAEPEPMEYVRVCDTYGVGYYYIPGTETCLKVSGYIRYDIGIGARGLQDVFDKEDFAEDGSLEENDTYFKRARFQLRVDSRAETELGTLRTYAAINFQYDTQDGDGFTYTQDELGIDHAYIELGGFRVGKTDSLFSTFTGYSSGVSNDGLVPYGPFGTHQIAYTFTGGNGFTAAVALEEGGSGEGNYDLFSYALDDYVPHVVGGIGWTGGWGGVSVVAGYDAVWKFNEKTAFNLEIGYDDFENFAVAANVDYELVQNFHVIPEITYEDNFDDDVDFDGDEWGGFLRLQANFGG